MPIDPSIALSIKPPQFDDPLVSQAKRVQLKALLDQQQQVTDERQATSRLNELYRSNVGPDGQLNQAGLISGAAGAGLGSRIPGLQKQFGETDKLSTENQASKYKLAKEQLADTNAGISSLLSDPQLSHDKVIDFIGSRVRMGLMTPQAGEEEVRELPGTLSGLRQKLYAKGLEGIEASKRLEMVLGKTELQDQGGTRQVFNVNQLTGQVTPGASFAKTSTPGELLTDERTRSEGAANRSVTMRGQDFVDARSRGGIEAGKVPAGYRKLPNGNLEFIPGGPADPATAKRAAPSEDERKAAGWLAQATNAFDNMEKAIKDNPKSAMPGLLESIPGPEGLKNMTRSEARQRFTQGASSFAEAALRAATGAGVNESEAKQKIAELTPQWGDKPSTIKQKRDGLQVYLDSLKLRAGRAVTTQPKKAGEPEGNVVDFGSLK